MSPDHNTPKGQRMAKTDHKLSPIPNEPPSCLFGSGNFYYPHSLQLTPQRELNEDIKYGERNDEEQKYGSLTKG